MSYIFPTILGLDWLKSGFQYQAQPAVIRTSMDAGIDKVRNRYTEATWHFSASMVISTENKRVVDQFFHQTLFNGAMPFSMLDPIDSNASYAWRFLAPPAYAPYGCDTLLVSFQLERIPASAIYPVPTVTVPAYFTGAVGSTTTTITAVTTFATWYQWQKDGVDIAGAVSPTYILPTIELADHRSIYTCKVGNPAAEVISGGVLFFTTSPVKSIFTADPTTYELVIDPDVTTVHASESEAFDYGGVSRTFKANEPVFGGAYTVRNIIPYSNTEDPSGIVLTGGALCTPEATYKDKDCIACYFDQSMSASADVRGSVFPLVAGNAYAWAVDIVLSRKLVNAEELQLRINGVSGLNTVTIDAVAGGDNVVKNQTADWMRVGRSKDPAAASGNVYFEVSALTVMETPITVYIADRHCEDITGKVNDASVVGWFVPTAGAEAVKSFDHYPDNAWDVATYVITMDSAAPTAIANPYLSYQPEQSNYAGISVPDSTTSYWLNTANFTLTDQGASTICPKQSAWKHQNNAVAAYARERSFPNAGVNGDPYAVTAIIEEGDSTTCSLAIYNLTDVWFLGRVTYTWATGVVSVDNDNGTVEYEAELLQTGVVKLTVFAEGTSADTGDSIKALVYPNKLTSNSDYAVIHYTGVFEATLGEVRGLGAIYATGSVATANRTDYQMPYGWARQDQGMFHYDIGLDRGEVQADIVASNLFRLSTTSGLSGILRFLGGVLGISSTNGTESSTVSASPLSERKDVFSLFDLDYSLSGILNVGVDGVYDATPDAYTTTFESDDAATFRVCSSNGYPQKIYSLDYHDLPYIDAKAISDSIMGV